MISPAPRTVAVAVALLALAGVTACADSDAAAGDPDKIDVVAAFYPLRFVAERVGGDAVTVTNLAKPGAEPHDIELNPGQVGQVTEAELIIYLKGFQPAVDEAIEQSGADRSFDVATVAPLLDASAGGHSHEEEEGEPAEEEAEHADEAGQKDPHVWLDPTRLATIGEKFAERLGAADPDRAADYTARAANFRTELATLDQEYETGLAGCQRREIVVSHTAFGYLAQRYELEQVGITGLTPEDEPSAQRLAGVAEEAREHGATTIFFETLVSPKVAETIAREVGAQTAVLDPIEGLQPGSEDDYFAIMRNNLGTLKTALSCP